MSFSKIHLSFIINQVDIFSAIEISYKYDIGRFYLTGEPILTH